MRGQRSDRRAQPGLGRTTGRTLHGAPDWAGAALGLVEPLGLALEDLYSVFPKTLLCPLALFLPLSGPGEF